MKKNNLKNNPLWKFIDRFITPVVLGICKAIEAFIILFAYALKGVLWMFVYVALGGFLFGNRK